MTRDPQTPLFLPIASSSDPIDPLVTTYVDAKAMLLITNLRGVFADLDDGGLTEDEALEQIRDILERAET